METGALSAGLLSSYFGETSSCVTEVKLHEFAMLNGTSSSGTTLRKSDSDSDYDVEVKFENSTGNENSVESSISGNENGEETVILDLDSTTKQAAAMSKGSSVVAGASLTGDGMFLTEPFHMSEVSHSVYSDSYFEYSKMSKSFATETETEPIGCNEDTDELIFMKKEDGDKPYKCSECPSAFKKMSNLKVHLRIHTGETPFHCLECPASFKSAGNLKIHMRIHTGEKPYQCPECSSAFARACDLKKHKITHTKEKPFTCSECHASFTVLSNLRRHMKIHVGDGKSYQ